MDKILLIDKPKGWTSFDVVAKIRSILSKQVGKRVKVGHAGTLDPLATGLLVILVGKATKKQDSLMKQEKSYEVEIRLGETSTTADDEGEKTRVSDIAPSLEQVHEVLAKFTGRIQQIPPIYSAIKVDGKRAYKLAREGKEIKLEPRAVTIHGIKDVEYDYPMLKFTADVSSGTYIRSLARDIGEELAVGAYMSNLRRIIIGNLDIKDAVTMEQVTPEYLTSVIVME